LNRVVIHFSSYISWKYVMFELEYVRRLETSLCWRKD
jgi:hypothetical protein